MDGKRLIKEKLPQGAILINRYRIEEVIGQGGFAITYRGFDMTLEIKVAVKEFYLSGVAKRNFEESLDVCVPNDDDRMLFDKEKKKFLSEARRLAQFADDPNVVSVKDYFESNETAYIVMEYLEGETLAKHTSANGTMSFDRAYELLRPVMESLSHIHESGLIHRDISPSNMILMDGDRVKLIDFGAARPTDTRNEHTVSVVLKPGFAPIEQYDSDDETGPWTDVYAMCASIYRLITGKNPESAIKRASRDSLIPPSAAGADISSEYENVLMRGLALHKDERISSMKELIDGFDDADDEKTLLGPKEAFAPKETLAPKEAFIPKEVPRPKPADEQKPMETPASTTEKAEIKNESKKKKQAGNRKAILAGLIAVAAIAAAVFFFTSSPTLTTPTISPNSQVSDLSDDAKAIYFYDETVTPAMIEKAAGIKGLEYVSFTACTLSDDALAALEKIDELKQVTIHSSTGFTTLNPLASVASLESLQLSGGSDGGEEIAEDALFTEDFKNINSLRLSDCDLTDTTSLLSHFTELQNLDLYQVSLPEGEKAFPKMDKLEHISASKTDIGNLDLSNLASSPNLKSVRFEKAGIRSLETMAGATKLSSIELHDNPLKSLSGTESMSDISYADLSGNELEDISAAASWKKLSSFVASDNAITDISALGNSTDMFTLELNNNEIEDISALKSMTNLRRLELKNNRINDASSLSGMTELVLLNISQNNISDLDFCNDLIKLEKLHAGGNKISSLDGMKNLTVLKDIHLEANEIDDISVIAKSAETLERLVLDDNNIADIGALKDCTNLIAFSANNNKLTNLNALKLCEHLVLVSAAGNEITDISALGGCKMLTAADLSDNEISDIVPLVGIESKDMVLLLHKNKIKKADGLGRDKKYGMLSIYSNDIKDISPLQGDSDSYSDGKLYLSFFDDLTAEMLAKTPYKTINIIDVPKDKQMKITNEASDLGIRVNFISEAEADAEIDEDRQSLRKEAGIVDAEDEEDGGDGDDQHGIDGQE